MIHSSCPRFGRVSIFRYYLCPGPRFDVCVVVVVPFSFFRVVRAIQVCHHSRLYGPFGRLSQYLGKTTINLDFFSSVCWHMRWRSKPAHKYTRMTHVLRIIFIKVPTKQRHSRLVLRLLQLKVQPFFCFRGGGGLAR